MSYSGMNSREVIRRLIARVGITMPQRVLDAIDRHAKAHGETRSGLLARAAVRYIGRDPGTMPVPTRGGSKRWSLRIKSKTANDSPRSGEAWRASRGKA